jgi:hypothetical protein
MRRREFIALLTGASLARAARAEAPPGAVVGFVGGALAPEHLQTAFHRGLNEAGYVEGRNVKFENRWAGQLRCPDGHDVLNGALSGGSVVRQFHSFWAIDNLARRGDLGDRSRDRRSAWQLPSGPIPLLHRSWKFQSLWGAH